MKTESCYQLFLRTLNSWCNYWKDPDDFQKKLGMPVVIHELVKPTFLDLSNETKFSNCFERKIQNANKSISNIIYTKCPPNIYIQLSDLEMKALPILLKVLKYACIRDSLFC